MPRRCLFADESYDVVLSTFGVMFAPDHSRAAYELFRVCRSGGCIGLANWTPEGFIGQLFKVVGRHVPPPPGLKPPALWGTPDYLAGLFPEGRVRIVSTKKTFAFRYRSAAHWIDVFRTWYGPVHKAFAALDAPRQLELEQDLRALIQSFDAGAGPAMSVPSEYLEVVIERL